MNTIFENSKKIISILLIIVHLQSVFASNSLDSSSKLHSQNLAPQSLMENLNNIPGVSQKTPDISLAIFLNFSLNLAYQVISKIQSELDLFLSNVSSYFSKKIPIFVLIFTLSTSLFSSLASAENYNLQEIRSKTLVLEETLSTDMKKLLLIIAKGELEAKNEASVKTMPAYQTWLNNESSSIQKSISEQDMHHIKTGAINVVISETLLQKLILKDTGTVTTFYDLVHKIAKEYNISPYIMFMHAVLEMQDLNPKEEILDNIVPGASRGHFQIRKNDLIRYVEQVYNLPMSENDRNKEFPFTKTYPDFESFKKINFKDVFNILNTDQYDPLEIELAATFLKMRFKEFNKMFPGVLKNTFLQNPIPQSFSTEDKNMLTFWTLGYTYNFAPYEGMSMYSVFNDIKQNSFYNYVWGMQSWRYGEYILKIDTLVGKIGFEEKSFNNYHPDKTERYVKDHQIMGWITRAIIYAGYENYVIGLYFVILTMIISTKLLLNKNIKKAENKRAAVKKKSAANIINQLIDLIEFNYSGYKKATTSRVKDSLVNQKIISRHQQKSGVKSFVETSLYFLSEIIKEMKEKITISLNQRNFVIFPEWYIKTNLIQKKRINSFNDLVNYAENLANNLQEGRNQLKGIYEIKLDFHNILKHLLNENHILRLELINFINSKKKPFSRQISTTLPKQISLNDFLEFISESETINTPANYVHGIYKAA
ncbi:MAG: hypothetical protein ACD_79C00105G0001 [uncultured bacterium]|nr:MAG: hypothetical protein ACD_79C00105G0001 [uncultured bacterium]